MIEKYTVSPKDVIHENTKLVIDFDSMLFKLASSAEKKEVCIIRKDNLQQVGKFKNKTSFFGRSRKTISEDSKLHAYNQELIKSGQDPLSHDDFIIDEVKEITLGNDILFRNLEAWVESLCSILDIRRSNVIPLMGDSGSFRDDLILPKKYKDNRDPSAKPLALKMVRDEFYKRFSPYMDDSLEADDVLAMYQYLGHISYKKTGKTDYIVSTIDKDAYGTAGFIINYDKAENKFKDTSLVYVPDAMTDCGDMIIKGKAKEKKGLGFKWFVYQALLIGDSGDNYFTYQYFDHLKGKYGKDQAFNDLKDLNTPKEILEYAVSKWREWFPDGYVEFTDFNGNPVKEHWSEFANKIFLAAYMKKSKTDTTDLFKTLKHFGVSIEKTP